ncbi:MAG: DUF4846 domain-containing protein [bacterium]
MSEVVSTPRQYHCDTLPLEQYSTFISALPLKPDTVRAQRYDSRRAYECCHDYRVVDLDFLFDADLEQCADMGYRLFAEYCYQKGKQELLDFRLQNGQRLSWLEWRSGKCLRYHAASDKHVVYQTAADSNRASFDSYLRYLFTWSGSWAVLKYAEPVDPDNLQPGDMIVQNRTGGMGHLSIIFNICRNQAGEKLYLIGSGWTPAQEIVIHRPAGGEGEGHWFTLAGYARHLAAFDFGPFAYRRFAGSAP